MSVGNPTIRVEFRPIGDFPGYRIGDDGSAWSRWVCAVSPGIKGRYSYLGSEWHELRARPVRGHPMVGLRRGGRQHQRYVHRLVLEAFVGPCPAGLMGRHLDDDPANNRVENLAWGTRLDNAADAVRNGRTTKGERSGNAKLTDEKVVEIREAYAAGEMDQYQLAARHGVFQTNICKIVTGEAWTHAGGPITRRGKGH